MDRRGTHRGSGGLVTPRLVILRDGLAAGSWAAVLGAIPSTVHGVVTRRPLDPTLAAGSILLPHEKREHILVMAAVPVHLALSFGWAAVGSVLLPKRSTAMWGLALGAAIAALDLGVIGKRFPRIRALPPLPQIADHLAYGLVVGFVVQRRRNRITD